MRVSDRPQLAVAGCYLLSVHAVQPVNNLWICHRIIKHIGINRDLLCAGRYIERSRFVRIQPFPVHIDKRYRFPEAACRIVCGIDIDLCHTRIARDIQISVVRQFAVGIACRGVRQPVIPAVVNRIHILSGEKLIHRQDIDSVAAQHPHLVIVVFIEIKIVGIGEFIEHRDFVIAGHRRDSLAGHNPEDIAPGIIFDAHHDTGCQSILFSDAPDCPAADDIDTVAVGAQNDISVRRAAHGQGLDIGDSLVRSETSRHAVALDDVDAARHSRTDPAVRIFADCPDLIRIHAVILGECDRFFSVISNQSRSAPGRDPDIALAVLEDRADTYALQQRDQITGSEISP